MPIRDDDITEYGIVDDADGSQFGIVSSYRCVELQGSTRTMSHLPMLRLPILPSGAGDNEYIVIVSRRRAWHGFTRVDCYADGQGDSDVM